MKARGEDHVFKYSGRIAKETEMGPSVCKKRIKSDSKDAFGEVTIKTTHFTKGMGVAVGRYPRVKETEL